MSRKILVILLASAMLVTFTPMLAFADTDEALTENESNMLTEEESVLPVEKTETVAEEEENPVQAGWDVTHIHYYNEDGSLAKGWIEEKHTVTYDDGETENWSDWYYADQNGELKTGWLLYKNNWYYLLPYKGNAYGQMCTTVARINGKLYYFNDNGIMHAKGWAHEYGYTSAENHIKLYYDEWYYAGSDGVLAEGWRKISGEWYYFEKSSGSMAANEFVSDSTGTLYAGSNGKLLRNTWIKYGGHWYYLNADGYMAKNSWRKDSKGWCWLGADGSMVTNAWEKDSGGWCFIGSDGHMVTNS